MFTAKSFKSEHWPKAVILLSVIISLWSASNIYWGKQHYTGIIKSDGKGYYAYLPAVFIYEDLNFLWVDSIEYRKYQNPNYFFDFRNTYQGHYIDKYYVGTALCMAPFFGLAHGLTNLLEGDADGYSRWYQLSAHWAAIFWLFVALWAINLFLKTQSFSAQIRALTLVFIYFGTNWFYYVIGEPSMSHAYSVGLVSLFALNMQRWIQEKRSMALFWAVFFLGWIFITRPVNVLMAGLVFPIAGHPKLLWARIRAWFTRSPANLEYLYLLVFLVPILPQMIIYKVQTGSWWIYSYQEEGFNFMKPEWLNLLFSYQKGFFVYTPLMFFALIGIFQIYRENKLRAWSILITLAMLVYVFSSWWNWYYGGSFSQRVFVDTYLIFAWLLASSLQMFGTGVKRILWLGILTTLLLFNQLQTYQYRYNIIHWSEMNKEKYWDVFLKLKP